MLTQQIFTCPKSKIETQGKLWNICSELTIKTVCWGCYVTRNWKYKLFLKYLYCKLLPGVPVWSALMHQFDLCGVKLTADYLMKLSKALTWARIRFQYIMLQSHNHAKFCICRLSLSEVEKNEREEVVGFQFRLEKIFIKFCFVSNEFTWSVS